MQLPEPGQPVRSSVIQQTSTDLPSIIETSTMTSAEGSTTINNTPTLANNLEPGNICSYICRHCIYAYLYLQIYNQNKDL